MKGAVAAGHPLTAEAGAQILEAGGNAVDACIAAAFVAWVAESPLTGPGAGGFMLVHRARDARDLLLDFFVEVPGRVGTGPAAPMRPVDIPFGAGDTTQRFLIGAPSCAVPGMVAGLADAHRLYGTISWAELLSPAITLARTGVELNEAQALLHRVLDAVLRQDPDGRAVYGGDRRLERGEVVVMRDFATTLDALAAEGSALFYRGELASKVSAEVLGRGGRISRDDLEAYRVVYRRPVKAAYRGHEVVSNPPPSSGGILIAFALRLLDRLGPGGNAGSVEAVARLAEIARAATLIRRGRFVADLHRGGLARRVLDESTIDTACHSIAGGRPPAVEPDPSALPSTTHVSVVDTRGNAASLSSSTGCGSGVVVPGTGIQLNNMLGEVDLNPAGTDALPGRRLTSMMAPSLVLAHGRPRLVLGSAGSERLRGAITQTVVNVIDHGLSLQAAIDRPRCHLDGDDLHLEGGIAEEVAESLERSGYGVVRWPGRTRNLYFGGVSAVAVDPDGSLEAAGDPRRGGAGVVVE